MDPTGPELFMALDKATADDGGEFDRALTKAKRGDGDGFEWLYRAYNRRVGAMVRSESCPDPDEVVNTVFFKAFRSIDRFVGNHANFASYLYQIARFQMIDDHRARNRQVPIDDDVSVDLVDDAAGPAELAVRSDDHSRTAEALQALTAEQREVIILRVFFGLTGPETAEALDKPVAAIRSLQNRAEARLRSLVESGSVAL
jgi:RNA polymerase sigma-70 factor (ECF subfamily)